MMKRTIKRCEEIGDVDLAVLLDTDGDRCGIVLRSGGTYKEVNRNRLIALCSQIVLEKDGDSNVKIITDSVTSIGENWQQSKTNILNANATLSALAFAGLESFISRAGGTQLRFKKGYLNVINEAKVSMDEDEQHNTTQHNFSRSHYPPNSFCSSLHSSQRRSALGEEIPLAMETSGHGAFKENNYCDDGTYTALLVACFIADNNNGKGVIEDFEDAGYEEEVRRTMTELMHAMLQSNPASLLASHGRQRVVRQNEPLRTNCFSRNEGCHFHRRLGARPAQQGGNSRHHSHPRWLLYDPRIPSRSDHLDAN